MNYVLFDHETSTSRTHFVKFAAFTVSMTFNVDSPYPYLDIRVSGEGRWKEARVEQGREGKKGRGEVREKERGKRD